MSQEEVILLSTRQHIIKVLEQHREQPASIELVEWAMALLETLHKELEFQGAQLPHPEPAETVPAA